jgi:transposase
MMGTLPAETEQPLFSYSVQLDRRLRANHPLRQLRRVLDLSFVAPAVQHCYGKSGNVSVDPQVIMKMMLLLFYYNIPSERELMEQIPERLDFLWFLGYDLDSVIPNHSVLSKARSRWGSEVFEKLFVRTIEQCVGAGLVDGRLLHIDSTTLKANASRNSVIESSPELVAALRQAYQEQAGKLELLDPPVSEAQVESSSPTPELPAATPLVQPAATAPEPAAEAKLLKRQKTQVNRTHVSRTDPEAHLALCKNGVTDLSYKDHRLVDDAHGVITAVEATYSTVADGTQLPGLVEQHHHQTGLPTLSPAIAGDKHYGTASNYQYCAEHGLRPHLAPASGNLKERGKLELSRFVYEPADDRYRCPQGHYLPLHQTNLAKQANVYLIEKAETCAQCPLRKDCTSSERGRSITLPLQAQLIAEGQQAAQSEAGRYSRKRRKHVMEGSFADAANNHGSKRARWRGLARQKIQSWLICAAQNLRILIHRANRAPKACAASLELIAKASENAVQRWLAALSLQSPPGCLNKLKSDC